VGDGGILSEGTVNSLPVLRFTPNFQRKYRQALRAAAFKGPLSNYLRDDSLRKLIGAGSLKSSAGKAMKWYLQVKK